MGHTLVTATATEGTSGLKGEGDGADTTEGTDMLLSQYEGRYIL